MKKKLPNNFILKPDFTQEEVTPKNDVRFTLEELQEHVGGYIEVINLDDAHVMVVNENGKYEHLEVNDNATVLAHAMNAIMKDDYIVGNAVIIENKLLD